METTHDFDNRKSYYTKHQEQQEQRESVKTHQNKVNQLKIIEITSFAQQLTFFSNGAEMKC